LELRKCNSLPRLDSLHVVRGTRTKLPGIILVPSCRPTANLQLEFPARPAAILVRTRSSINCRALRSAVSRFCPRVLAWRLLAAFASVGTAVRSEGHSRIAPLHLCPHHLAGHGACHACRLWCWSLASFVRSTGSVTQSLRESRAVQNPKVPVVQGGGSRLTNRCSGRGRIKCLAAGGQAPCAHERYRARVLRGRRAAAELNR
jgi:hypothetical protein